MKENLRITTVQTSLHWEDIEANLSMFSKKLESLAGQTDLVVLPEMFTTGFSMEPSKLAEGMSGKTMQWLQEQAKRLDAAVTGSFIATEGGKFFNRLVWMQPDGNFQTYDKRHLFTLAGEHEAYTAGRKKLLVEWQGWKFYPLICFDLRFPIWSRNAEGYDVLIYVANWPDRRSFHWQQLLVARAIENQTYVVGVNRVGKDEKGLTYSGDSSVVDFSGKTLYRASEIEAIFTSSLSAEMLNSYRKSLQFLADQDDVEIFLDGKG